MGCFKWMAEYAGDLCKGSGSLGKEDIIPITIGVIFIIALIFFALKYIKKDSEKKE